MSTVYWTHSTRSSWAAHPASRARMRGWTCRLTWWRSTAPRRRTARVLTSSSVQRTVPSGRRLRLASSAVLLQALGLHGLQRARVQGLLDGRVGGGRGDAVHALVIVAYQDLLPLQLLQALQQPGIQGGVLRAQVVVGQQVGPADAGRHVVSHGR